jgi:hypothetical protein
MVFWYAFGTHDGYTLWGGPRQRVHGRGCAGDQWRRCAELVPSTKRWTPCARPSKSSTERLAHSGSRASDPLSRRLPGVRGDAEAAELAAGLIELAANTDTL